LREAGVLALLWGDPVRVLVVRKSCSGGGYWACDIALPGGGVKPGEDPVSAALREAWEEAWVHPATVKVLGVLEPEYTRLGTHMVYPVLARPRGPLCPRPVSGEVDAVFWLPLGLLDKPPSGIDHPARGFRVEGYRVGGGVLWGATLRILSRIYRRLQDSSTV